MFQPDQSVAGTHYTEPPGTVAIEVDESGNFVEMGGRTYEWDDVVGRYASHDGAWSYYIYIRPHPSDHYMLGEAQGPPQGSGKFIWTASGHHNGAT